MNRILGFAVLFGVFLVQFFFQNAGYAQPVVTIFPPPHPPVAESATSVFFQLRANSTLSSPVDVQFTIAGTATNGQDYRKH
ncbi:hypothetical protein L0156_16445 [bacterium]|nr:hypothetical protein [bacterium]